MSTDNNKDSIDWNSVVKKGAIGIDGLDLGEVQEVGDSYIITQKGLLNKKRYHIPISSVESFDGDILKMRINEVELEGYEEGSGQKFEGYSSFKSSDMSKELETKIPVMGENMVVTKKITEDKVDIIKEPIKETKTVEIELSQEMITIERKPVDDESYSDVSSMQPSDRSSLLEGSVESRTQISIPLRREEPIVSKTPYVKEEVIVKKKPITEKKTVTAEITTENIYYNNQASQKLDGIKNSQPGQTP